VLRTKRPVKLMFVTIGAVRWVGRRMRDAPRTGCALRIITMCKWGEQGIIVIGAWDHCHYLLSRACRSGYPIATLHAKQVLNHGGQLGNFPRSFQKHVWLLDTTSYNFSSRKYQLVAALAKSTHS